MDLTMDLCYLKHYFCTGSPLAPSGFWEKDRFEDRTPLFHWNSVSNWRNRSSVFRTDSTICCALLFPFSWCSFFLLVYSYHFVFFSIFVCSAEWQPFHWAPNYSVTERCNPTAASKVPGHYSGSGPARKLSTSPKDWNPTVTVVGNLFVRVPPPAPSIWLFGLALGHIEPQADGRLYINKMQPTNPNAHTYVHGTDVETHGYAVT